METEKGRERERRGGMIRESSVLSEALSTKSSGSLKQNKRTELNIEH